MPTNQGLVKQYFSAKKYRIHPIDITNVSCYLSLLMTTILKTPMHTSDIIRRIPILIFTLIYFLTPYSIKRLNSGCACGCEEFICSCCKATQHLKNSPCFTTYNCRGGDEQYEQSPSVTESFFGSAVIHPIGNVLFFTKGEVLPGYKRPPMKPPPLT